MMFSVLPKIRCLKTCRSLTHLKLFSTQKSEYVYPNPEDDYSKYVEYPQIEPTSSEYCKKKEIQAWYDKIKRQKTVEEKLFEINVPRYWGWKCLLLKEGEIPFNSLDFTKFITRTHLIETDLLPGNYQDFSSKYSQLATYIKDHLEDQICDSLKIRHKYTLEDNNEVDKERKSVSFVIEEINRLLLKFLSKENSDLGTCQVDYNPRIESYWNLGSLNETYVPKVHHHGLPLNEIPEEYIGRPSDKYIQYIGNPIIQIRSENPLPPLVKHETVYLQYPVPIYKYDPFVVFGYEMVRRHVTNIPGFWPGEPREYSFLSYHDISHMKHRPETYDDLDAKETLQCHAIFASFAWLMSLASYQGFTTFHDVTYPFVTQTILTDGREFSFAVYQLNTTELYHPDPLYNPKCNICWITPKMSLYNVEGGEIKGLNENVIKMLIQFYMKKTEELDKCVRKPYLGDNIRLVANYEDEEKRTWLEREFKHFSSNRPRHRVDKMYEVADYERIYKIEFRKLVRDKRSRPFELRENPYLRKMNEHTGEYIPKACRPDSHLPKYKQRAFRKTFYPE